MYIYIHIYLWYINMKHTWSMAFANRAQLPMKSPDFRDLRVLIRGHEGQSQALGAEAPSAAHAVPKAEPRPGGLEKYGGVVYLLPSGNLT